MSVSAYAQIAVVLMIMTTVLLAKARWVWTKFELAMRTLAECNHVNISSV